jgi:4'-phosphopantetheinyl transferase
MKSNVVHIFFCKIDYPISQEFFDNYYQKLPIFIQLSVDSYFKIEDKIRSILGKYLLLYGLRKMGFAEDCLHSLDFQENNRPYLKKLLMMDFNISHAAAMVICVLSTSVKVGVDIEKLGSLDLLNLKNQLSATEWEAVEQTNRPTELFFKYWVQKESIVKACNSHIPFHQIEVKFNRISIDKKTWYSQAVDIHQDYLCYLTSSDLAEIIVEEVFFCPDGTVTDLFNNTH